MQQLNENLCELFFEVSYVFLDDWRELRSGRQVGALLKQIDPAFFGSEEPCENWLDVQGLVERFLAAKGLGDRTVNLEVERIAEGSQESLATALVQIVSILAVFQPQKWRLATTHLKDGPTANLCSLINNLADELKNKGVRLSVAVKKEAEGQRLKDLLLKLEQTESSLEDANTSNHQLRKDLAIARKELVDKDRRIEEQQQTLEEAGRIKNQLIAQIEANINNRRTSHEEGWQSKLDTLTSELEFSNRNLFELRTKVVEKDEEISKKDVHLAILTEKQAELEELLDQLASQKRMLDIVRKDNELLEQRLQMQLTDQLESDASLRRQLESVETESQGLKADIMRLKKMNTFLVKMNKKPPARQQPAKENPESDQPESLKQQTKPSLFFSVFRNPSKMESETTQRPLAPLNISQGHKKSISELPVIATPVQVGDDSTFGATNARIDPLDFFGETLNFSCLGSIDGGRPSESPFSPTIRPEHASILYSLLTQTMARDINDINAFVGRDLFRKREILRHFELTALLDQQLR
jgi:hypothetical protein